MNESQCSYMNASRKTKAQDDTETSRCGTPSSYNRRHDVEKWLQRQSKGHENKTGQSSSTLMDLVEKSVGGNNVVSQQNYFIGIYEIVVSLLAIFYLLDESKYGDGHCHGLNPLHLFI